MRVIGSADSCGTAKALPQDAFSLLKQLQMVDEVYGTGERIGDRNAAVIEKIDPADVCADKGKEARVSKGTDAPVRLTLGQTKADPMETFLPNTIGRFKAMLDDLAHVTQHQVNKTRAILRELMGKEIVLHPTADGVSRYLTAEMSGNYAGLMRLSYGKNKHGGGHGS